MPKVKSVQGVERKPKKATNKDAPKKALETPIKKKTSEKNLDLHETVRGRVRKGLIIDAQKKEIILPRVPLQRLVTACCRNWVADGKIRIKVEALDTIRQCTEFIMNDLMRKSYDAMIKNTTRKSCGQIIHNVRLRKRDVEQVLQSNDFFIDVTRFGIATMGS